MAEILWFWSNSNTETNLAVTFEPSTTIPSSGKILLGFPIIDPLTGTTLFSRSLGIAGVTETNNKIKCYAAPGGMSPIKHEITCKILYGAYKSAYIEVSGFQDITSISSFLIPGILNPTVVDDSVSIDLELIALDHSGTVLNERVIFDVVAP